MRARLALSNSCDMRCSLSEEASRSENPDYSGAGQRRKHRRSNGNIGKSFYDGNATQYHYRFLGARMRQEKLRFPAPETRRCILISAPIPMQLLLRWVITALALFVAAWLVPGIRVAGQGWVVFSVMAVILGLVNAVIRPVLKLLSCPLIILTLGFFVLVINGITLWLASAIAVSWFHVGFYVDGFGAAFLGAVIVSIVSVILTALLKEQPS